MARYFLLPPVVTKGGSSEDRVARLLSALAGITEPYALEYIGDGRRVVISVISESSSPPTALARGLHGVCPPYSGVLASDGISASFQPWKDARETLFEGLKLAAEHASSRRAYSTESRGQAKYHSIRGIQVPYSPIFANIISEMTGSGGLVRLVVTPMGGKGKAVIKRVEDQATGKRHRDARGDKALEAKLLSDKASFMQFGVKVYALGRRGVIEHIRGLVTDERDVVIKEDGNFARDFLRAYESRTFREFDARYAKISGGAMILDPGELALLAPLPPSGERRVVSVPAPPPDSPPPREGDIILGFTYTETGIEAIRATLDGFAAGMMVEGLPGSGKTVMGLSLVPQLYRSGANIVVLDPKMSLADEIPAVMAKEFGESVLKNVIYIPADEVAAKLNFFVPTKQDRAEDLAEWFSEKLIRVFEVEGFGEKSRIFRSVVLAALRLAFLKRQNPNFVDFADAVKAVVSLSDRTVIATPDEELNNLIKSIRSHWDTEERAREYTAPLLAAIRELIANVNVIQSFVSRDPLTLDDLFGTVNTTYSPENKVLIVRMSPSLSEAAVSMVVRMVFLMVQRWMQRISERAKMSGSNFRPVVIVTDEAHRIANQLAPELETVIAEGRGLGIWPILLFQTRFQIASEEGRRKLEFRKILLSILGVKMHGELDGRPEDIGLQEPFSEVITTTLPRYWFVYSLPSRVLGQRMLLLGYPGPPPEGDPRFRPGSPGFTRYKEWIRKVYCMDRETLEENLRGVPEGKNFFQETLTRLDDVSIACLVAKAILEGKNYVEVDRVNARRVARFLTNIRYLNPNVRVEVRVRA